MQITKSKVLKHSSEPKKIDIELLKFRVKQTVNFSYFRDGCLWYKTHDNWEFPISVEETINKQGNSPTFNACEKGIILMRWIRKHMELEVTYEMNK